MESRGWRGGGGFTPRPTFSFQATPTHSTLTKVIVWRALRFAAIKTTQSRAFVGIQLRIPGIYILPKREFRNEFRGYRCWTRGQAAPAPAGRHGSQGRPGAVPREDQGPRCGDAAVCRPADGRDRRDHGHRAVRHWLAFPAPAPP